MSELITDLRPAPNRDNPDTLDDDADSFFGKLPQFRDDLIAFAAMFNMLMAGTAYAIPYTFSTLTADADPGVGTLRLDNATQNAAVTLRADTSAVGGVDFAAVLDTFDASTSTIKGALKLMKAADPTKYLLFNVTARAAPAGYRNFTVAYVGGSSASPFANGDLLLLAFTPKGDKGDIGVTSALLHVQDEKASGTNGGASAAGVNTRVLNTVKKNGIAGASLSSNQITLPAGTYRVRASAPAFQVLRHRAYLYNVTDAGTALLGSSEYTDNAYPYVTRSHVNGEIVIAAGATKVFELRHYCAGLVSGNGLGVAVIDGSVEVYSQLLIEKVA